MCQHAGGLKTLLHLLMSRWEIYRAKEPADAPHLSTVLCTQDPLLTVLVYLSSLPNPVDAHVPTPHALRKLLLHGHRHSIVIPYIVLPKLAITTKSWRSILRPRARKGQGVGSGAEAMETKRVLCILVYF